MMKEETAKRIENFKNEIGNRPFTEKEIKGIVSLSTLYKYKLIKSVEVEVYREEVTLDELINTVNDMMGEDCYGCEGYYKREGNKIFYVRTDWRYVFK